MSVTSSGGMLESFSASTRKRAKAIDFFEESRDHITPKLQSHVKAAKRREPREEDYSSPNRIVASLISMLPTFSPSKVFGRGDDLLRTLEERLLNLERRMMKDEGFRDARFEQVESEFSRRVSILEMQVAQMQAELRAKQEMIMRLSGHI